MPDFSASDLTSSLTSSVPQSALASDPQIVPSEADSPQADPSQIDSPQTDSSQAVRSASAANLPNQRWQIAEALPEQAAQLTQSTQLPPLLTQVLINRGIATLEAAQAFLNPEVQQLPAPIEEFPDLAIALELLISAITNRYPIAICGDYDADGMTSTALLMRSLRYLGAIVDYAIPSRMEEGYGINRRIVEEFHDEGVRLILTVDNGIAAYDPIARARELGLFVIVTDHHDIPTKLPPANAILNPKLIPETSPYWGVAGVGVAYILAVCLAQSLNKTQALTGPLLELFTLGTIADLAPLTGVNRRWVRRGLTLLPQSRLAGVQALIQVAGLSQEQGALKPEAIGFRLGPRINAVGRIADPQVVIDLLTTDDEGEALDLAMQCEAINQQRRFLCEQIEQEAIAWCGQQQLDLERDRVLVVVQPNWHHGVIGIVASRLVERYGVPVFIGTYEDADGLHVRGSARSIPEFNVFEALQFCDEVLEKYGGHRAAGGFSLTADNLEEFQSRLQIFARQQLQPEFLKPLVTIDAQAALHQVDLNLYEQIDVLHPCGIENPDPVFWTPNVRVVEQRTIGQRQAHLKVTLIEDAEQPSGSLPMSPIKAIAWRWGEYYPLPNRVDIAYRLRLNDWNGVKTVELELVGVRSPSHPSSTFLSAQSGTPLDTSAAGMAAMLPGLEFASVNSQPANPQSASSPPKKSLKRTVRSNDATSDDLLSPLPIISPAEERLASTPLGLPFSPEAWPKVMPGAALKPVAFSHNQRQYTCSLSRVGEAQELRIKNQDGQVLAVQPQQKVGLLGKRREDAKTVDVTQPRYSSLIQTALNVLAQAEQRQLLQEKDRLLAAKEAQIALLNQQLSLLSSDLAHLSVEQQEQLEVLEAQLQDQKLKVKACEAQVAQMEAGFGPEDFDADLP